MKAVCLSMRLWIVNDCLCEQDLIHATVMREIFREQALLKASNEVQYKESKLFRKQFKHAAIQQIEMLEEKEAQDLAR